MFSRSFLIFGSGFVSTPSFFLLSTPHDSSHLIPDFFGLVHAPAVTSSASALDYHTPHPQDAELDLSSPSVKNKDEKEEDDVEVKLIDMMTLTPCS